MLNYKLHTGSALHTTAYFTRVQHHTTCAAQYMLQGLPSSRPLLSSLTLTPTPSMLSPHTTNLLRLSLPPGLLLPGASCYPTVVTPHTTYYARPLSSGLLLAGAGAATPGAADVTHHQQRHPSWAAATWCLSCDTRCCAAALLRWHHQQRHPSRSRSPWADVVAAAAPPGSSCSLLGCCSLPGADTGRCAAALLRCCTADATHHQQRRPSLSRSPRAYLVAAAA